MKTQKYAYFKMKEGVGKPQLFTFYVSASFKTLEQETHAVLVFHLLTGVLSLLLYR